MLRYDADPIPSRPHQGIPWGLSHPGYLLSLGSVPNVGGFSRGVYIARESPVTGK
jgi:hypothetical protein